MSPMSKMLPVIAVATASACSGPLPTDAPNVATEFGFLRRNLTVTTLEVNQALGIQYMGAQKFVAGKDTAVIAYLSDPVEVDAAMQTVVVKLNGTMVATLTPNASDAPTNTLIFLCPSREACGKWAAGAYTFEASINGVTSTASANFIERRTLKILAVPVKVAYGADIREPDEKWKKAGDFTRAVFPVANDKFQ